MTARMEAPRGGNDVKRGEDALVSPLDQVLQPSLAKDIDPPERYQIVKLRELDLENYRDLTIYYRLLTHGSNVEHFANPPTSPLDLKGKLEKDRTHAYLAENGLGEVVGAGGINDAEPGQHDHFLVKMAIHPRFQGRKVGQQLMFALIDTAFSTPTYDGREREKLDGSVIEGMRGWERMTHILDKFGFHFVSRLRFQVDVRLRDGTIVRKPTQRFEILREDWAIRRPYIAKLLGKPVN